MLVYQRVSDFFPWEFLWMAHWHTPRKHESPKFGFGIWFSFGRCIHCWQNLYKISLFNPHFPDFKRSQNQIHAVSIQSATVSICFAIFSHVFRHVLPYLSHVCPIKISMKSMKNFPPGKPWRWPWTASRPPARPFSGGEISVLESLATVPSGNLMVIQWDLMGFNGDLMDLPSGNLLHSYWKWP